MGQVNAAAYQFLQDALARIQISSDYQTNAGSNIAANWFGYAIEKEDAIFPLVVVEPSSDQPTSEVASEAKRNFRFNVVGIVEAINGPNELIALADDIKQAIGSFARPAGFISARTSSVDYVVNEKESALAWVICSVEIVAAESYRRA